MDDFSSKGYDTWAMDFRGYGHSTRPAAMQQPPQSNKPVVRATDGVKDLAAVVEYICQQRKVDKISIVGWSWGAVVGGMYTAQNPDRVEKLVLYGAMHGFELPSMAKTYEAPDKPGVINAAMPAYQIIDWEKAIHHWHMMLNGKDLVEPKAWEAVKQVFNASDPASSSRDNHAVQRPMGPLVDLYEIWSNRAIFDAGAIQAPVLIIRGDLDIFADPGLINKLTKAKNKKEVVIKDATHWALYEKHRDELIEQTDTFLQGK
ncbi:alpha/beta hydrolase [Paenibacillus albiflavus]|nr:alpha/beta hydrolase [Paenibacillus albiflavus]